MVNVFPIPALKDNYIWCLEKDRLCLIVDPGEADSVVNMLEKYHFDLRGILITHHHYDHTNGIPALLTYKRVPVIGPAAISKITDPLPSDNHLFIPDLEINFTVISVPGHTKEHVAYYAPTLVFTGDTLFTAGCGKIFEGTAKDMYQSLEKLRSLPDDTRIFCGHEYTVSNLHFAAVVEPTNKFIKERLESTLKLRQQNRPTVPALLALEKKTNPFLRYDHVDVIRAASLKNGTPLTNSADVLKVLREWKNQGNYERVKS